MVCILDEKQNEHIFQATYNAVTFTIEPRNFARSGVSRDGEKVRVQVRRANSPCLPTESLCMGSASYIATDGTLLPG